MYTLTHLYTLPQTYVGTNTNIASVCIGWLIHTNHITVLRITCTVGHRTVDIYQSVVTMLRPTTPESSSVQKRKPHIPHKMFLIVFQPFILTYRPTNRLK